MACSCYFLCCTQTKIMTCYNFIAWSCCLIKRYMFNFQWWMQASSLLKITLLVLLFYIIIVTMCTFIFHNLPWNHSHQTIIYSRLSFICYFGPILRALFIVAFSRVSIPRHWKSHISLSCHDVVRKLYIIACLILT